MTDLERLAREIYRVELMSFFEGWIEDEIPKTNIEEMIHERWRSKKYEARAFLKVLRNPSEAMLAAASAKQAKAQHFGTSLNHHGVFTSMIDSILEESND